MVRAFVRWAPAVIGAVALFLMLRSMLGQVAIQSELNLAMTGVLENVREARLLTRETAEALAPLGRATAALERMNGRLRAMTGDLKEMNATLEGVVKTQDGMLSGLGSLNERTALLPGVLGEIGSLNAGLLLANQEISRQASGQASALQRLAALTDQSVSYLRSVNRRLSFLRR